MYSVFGTSPTDVWAGGHNGSLYHFNGATWSRMGFDSTSALVNISGYGLNTYAIVQRSVDFSPPDSAFYFFYEFSGNTWVVRDAFIITPQSTFWKFGGFKSWTSPAGKLYTSSYGVYLREGSSWQQMFYDNWPTRVRGLNDQNIFSVGDQGRVFHWNGTDWKKIVELESGYHRFTSAWVHENETFIVGTDGRYTYIAHGK